MDKLFSAASYPMQEHRGRDIRAGYLRGFQLEFHLEDVGRRLVGDPIWVRALELASESGTLIPHTKLANLFMSPPLCGGGRG